MIASSALRPLLASLALASALPHAQAITVDFTSTSNAALFSTSGSSLDFTTVNPDFQIGISDFANGLFGDLDGSFTLGTAADLGDGVMVATGSGLGTFQIFDGAALFSGTFGSVRHTTFDEFGMLEFTVSGLSYNGTNTDLIALGATGWIGAVISYQAAQSADLAFLTSSFAAPSNFLPSFSGTLVTIPEGGSAVAMLGMAMLGLGAATRRSRKD